MTRTAIVADLFCGAGGTSTGLIRAARERKITLDLMGSSASAVNI